ncbi:MAG TPA: lysylphosphatidylglycerol synthase transmembrane domain-containing protein [Abditibacteriaceae bacterium]|nr:lysylphosphatidylglycerol synthase transmembrane domain-containing protein [Abditibacteriaceae bacterium]
MTFPSFSTMQTAAKNSSGFQAILRWLLRFVVGLAIVMFLAQRHDTASLMRTLRAVTWWVPLISVVFYWLGQVLSAWKWQLLLRAQGARVSLRDCCRLYAVGMFWNLWMPTNIGGDAIRAVRCAPLCGGLSVATSSVLVERLTGVIALLTIAVLGLLAQLMSSSANQTNFLILRPILFVVVLLICLFALFRALRPKFAAEGAMEHESAIQRKVRSFSRALSAYAQPSARGALQSAIAISLLFQASQVLLNIGLARAMGLPISFAVFWWLVPSLAIASLVPLGIGGLGIREAAAVQLLAGQGAPAASIVAWSLLWQATVWLASLPGGLWVAQRMSAPET